MSTIDGLQTSSAKPAVSSWWRLLTLLSRHRTGPIVAGIAVVGTLVEWMRLPSVARETLWAEDARRFLNNAVARGSFPALFTPYAGYLHTIPRLIAGTAVSFAPIDDWALVMSFGSCLVAGVVAALVFVCSRVVFATWQPRLLLAAITLLDPLAPHEVLGNTANLHWYFLWLAPWLILYRPRSRAGAWVLGIAALFAGLTEIQMAFFIPFLAWQRKDRRRWPTRGLLLVGLVAQILTTLFAPRGTFSGHLIGLPSLVDGYFINAVATIWLPTSASVGWVFTHGAGVIPALLLLPFLLAAIWGFVNGSSISRLLIATMLLGSFILYVAAVEVTPASFSDYAHSTAAQWANPWRTRYGVVPSMMLLALIPLAIWGPKRVTGTAKLRDRLMTSSRTRTVKWASVVVMVALLLAQFVPATTRRDNGPRWQPQVAAQREFCQSKLPSTHVSLAGAPGAAWLVEVPCSLLTG